MSGTGDAATIAAQDTQYAFRSCSGQYLSVSDRAPFVTLAGALRGSQGRPEKVPQLRREFKAWGFGRPSIQKHQQSIHIHPLIRINESCTWGNGNGTMTKNGSVGVMVWLWIKSLEFGYVFMNYPVLGRGSSTTDIQSFIAKPPCFLGFPLSQLKYSPHVQPKRNLYWTILKIFKDNKFY